MAITSTVTWLPLDRWFAIFGLDPWHANGIYTLKRPSTVCSDPWLQWAWQNSDRIGREELARAIYKAERDIARALGYFLIPDFVSQESQVVDRPGRPEMFATSYRNLRGLPKTVQTNWGYVISGGIEKLTAIKTAAVITWSDADGDGYAETGTVSNATTVTDACRIVIAYPGKSGAARWRIRPIEATISGGIVTVTFKKYQAVLANLMETLGADADQTVRGVDGDVVANFLTTVDIYERSIDPSKQVTLLWEPTDTCDCGSSDCVQCTYSTQTGCLLPRDERLGLVAYRPASWDAVDEQFDAAELAVCRDPDKLHLWYYAGYTSDDPQVACPRLQMDPDLELAVAYYAAALLDHEICACSNIQTRIEYWRTDRALIQSADNQSTAYRQQHKLLDNPFGTTHGAIFAWQRVQERAPLGKAVSVI